MADETPTTYYLALRGEIYGPLGIDEITKRIQDGRLTPREWIFLPEGGDWFPIIEVPQLAGLFYSAAEKPAAAPGGQSGRTSTEGTTLAHVGSDRVEFGGQMVEKRRWVRLPTALTLRFGLDAQSADAQKILEATTADLSEGGLGFRWPQEIPIGTFVQIWLDIFPNELKTKGRVARCRPRPDGDFDVGVLFVTLTEKDHKNVKAFISSAAAIGG